jgi:hypothetical protein
MTLRKKGGFGRFASKIVSDGAILLANPDKRRHKGLKSRPTQPKRRAAAHEAQGRKKKGSLWLQTPKPPALRRKIWRAAPGRS